MNITIIKGPHFEKNVEKAQRIIAEIIREKAKEIEEAEKDKKTRT